MNTPLKQLRWRVEAMAMRLLLGLFRMVGVDRASGIGGWVGRTIGPRLGVTRRAERNIRACFPDKSDSEITAIICEMWDNLGRTVAEYAHLGAFRIYAPDSRVTVTGMEHLERIVGQGNGAIFVSGHFANWELPPIAASHRNLKTMEVYRAANNPLADEIILNLRRTHVTPYQAPKGSAGARKLVPWLKQGNYIAMLVDQKMNDGIEAPFMGRPAMSPPAAAQLARRFGCPILPATIRRIGGAHFVLDVEEPIYVAQGDDREADILAAVTETNRRLEKFIRAYPGQWLWLHRRWPDS